MRQCFALFAAELNVQQMLATGVIGGGAALIVGVVAQFFQRPQPPAKGEPAPKKLSPLVALLLLAVGLGLVVGGAIWRVESQGGRR
jgi:hypothetical protein